ncbi:MAG: glycosyltransferase family 4 protein, partial [Syntrophaceae bacterium]|nr:glycosyltransferase family 4 protein [Syntrophaceae bacterium]
MNDKPILFPAKLVVITTNYPSTANPAYGTFVRQFAHAVARQGVKCIVVHPVPVHDAMQSKGLPFHDEEDAGSGNYVKVYRPRFFSLSARESFVGLGPLNPSLFTLNQFTRSVRRVLRSQKIEPDALYGHFLFLSGAAAVRLGAEMGIPAFPCIGESGLWTVRVFGVNRAIKELASASGFLANSTLLKEILHNDLFIASDRIGVFPNGTDLKLFKPQDKWTARKRFGLPHNCFLVASVGNFSMRKGIARIGEAIEGLQGVAGVFAGAGNEPPRVGNIVFCRQLAH